MKKSKGFTLIELVIVLAIIGILMAIVMANLNTARAKSRDTRRIADISNIQLGLAFYLNKYGSYPQGTWSVLESKIGASSPEKYTNPLPQDPANSGKYVYGYSSADGTSYCLGATLEATSSIVSMAETCLTDNSNNNYKVKK